MTEEIMVSVCCLVYNHAKYLRKCLDGFVMQKTNFKFEVLIHDDASTDGSQDIIREYEEKYPDIIKPIYQKENQYSKHIGINKTYQYPRVKGKYIAFCEGDDYWSDPNKLQKQFDIMENNLDCSICVHGVNCISEDGKRLDSLIPEIKMNTGKYTPRKWLKLFFKHSSMTQTTSFFLRSELIVNILDDLPAFFVTSPVGDKAIMLLSVANGSIYFINEYMSTYRFSSKGSWTEHMSSCSKEIKKAHRKKSIKTLDEYNEYTNFEFDNLIEYAKGKYGFAELIESGEYRKLFCGSNIKYFIELPIKQKIYYLVYGVFPFLKEK